MVHLFRGRLYGTGRQNFIFGPWSETTSGKWAKVLQDGQSLEVPRPPSRDAIAIINPENMLLATDKKASMIQGIVTRLVLEKPTQEIIIIVQAENQALTARVSPEKAHEHALYPGQKIQLYYEPEDIIWY